MKKSSSNSEDRAEEIKQAQEEPKAAGETAPAPDTAEGTSASVTAGSCQETPPKTAEEPSPPTIDPMLERLMRLQADFENYRKRVARERVEMAQRASEQIIRELLPVLDHFELCLTKGKELGVSTNVLEGFELLYDELMGILAKHGLAVLRPEPGQPFDPHVQEAVAHVPSPDFPADTVVELARCGYTLAGKLLRPAQVVVSSGPPEVTSE